MRTGHQIRRGFHFSAMLLSPHGGALAAKAAIISGFLKDTFPKIKKLKKCKKKNGLKRTHLATLNTYTCIYFMYMYTFISQQLELMRENGFNI